MLSDEEREALEILKAVGIKCKEICVDEVIINLIKKQQKEIEELKAYKHDTELTKIACCTAQNCEALNNCIKLERKLQNADKKWEDKIKAKIEEMNKDFKEYENGQEWEIQDEIRGQIEVLQSLLEKE